MANRSTMPPAWRALAKACGGTDALARELDVSKMQLYRLARGQARVRKPVAHMIRQIAQRHGVADPLPKMPDLEPLELLGSLLARGLRPATPIAHARVLFPEDALIELAEKDDLPPDAMRAVAFLLGLDDEG